MAWHKVLALGALGSALAVGCVVTTGDGDDDDGRGGTGGTTGTAGSGGGADTDAGTGGSAGEGGSAGTAGTSSGGTAGSVGSGGSGGGETFTCDPEDPSLSECDACVHEKCCTELLDCGDDEDCGGTEDEEGEIQCFFECMDDLYEENGIIDLENDTPACVAQCAKNALPTIATEDLVSCINHMPDEDIGDRHCSFECFGTL